MRALEKKIKKRYLLFISTIILIIISVLFIIQNTVNNQKQDALLINKSGKQRMLSQSISKIASSIEDNHEESNSTESRNSLHQLTNELENTQRQLYFNNNLKVDSLLKIAEPALHKIITSSRNILSSSDFESIKKNREIIEVAEQSFMLQMDNVVNEYQNAAEQKLQNLLRIIYLLAVLAALILIGEFLFVLVPVFRQIFKKSDELLKANNELAKSEDQIKENMLELTKLKTDLEVKEKYNKIFIEQAPTAIAMLDNDMRYIAVSKHWIEDYKMKGQEIIGRSHYELFPEIGEDWKEIHKKCLNGYIDSSEEAPFVRADGTTQWIFWDVRPWYISEGIIGGLIMHTGDITFIKEKDQEKARIEKILESTNKVARIGTWELDVTTDKYTLSKITCEILKVPENFEAYHKKSLHFYKEGISRDRFVQAMSQIIEKGISFDIEVEMNTADGNSIWIRKIAQAEFTDGKCERIYGIFQDITAIKNSEKELYDAHMQLQAILNSGPIAIVTTDNTGLITYFNHGAEVLLGYSADEMVGLQQPSIYRLEEDLLSFKEDIAKRFHKDLADFNPFQELAINDAFDTREWTCRRKDGTLTATQLTVTAIKNEDGEQVGFLGVSFDITDRKIAQSELLRKNKLLNHAEEISSMGHWQWDTIADKVVWSNNLYKMFELNEATVDLNFNTYFNYVHPDDKEIVTAYFSKAAEDKKFDSFTHRITTNGKIKTVQLLGEVITNYKGEVTEMIGTCQDISEQRLAENKFRGLLESAPDAMVIVNEKGKIQLVNKQAEKLFGYPAEELLEKSVEILIPKRFTANHAGHRDAFFANPNTRGMGEGKELFGMNKTGTEFPIQISLSPLQTEEGLLVSAAIRDITAQKVAENELLRKNQLLTFAEKITMMGNWQWNTITNVVKWSANLFQIFGLDESTELTYDTYFSFVHPEDQERVTEHVQRALLDKKFIDLIHRIQLQNGAIKTIQLLAEVNMNAAGDVTELIGTCQDVTEQRMAENKFRGLLESAPDAMVIVNEKGKIQLVNKQAEKLFGYSAKELLEKPVEILIPQRFTGNHKHKAHRDGFFSNPNTRGMGEGKELYGINKQGEEIPIQISLSPLKTEEGLLVSAAIRDITAQKLAAHKINESKESLEVLANKLTAQNVQLADFAHITSHNLRAPVSNLNSLLEFYKTSESEEDKTNLFDKFEKVINHLTLTLNTLVEAIKTKNETSAALEDIAFDEVLNKTKEILSGEILKTGTVITSNFSKISNISYNKVYLESIFLNLVGNAIKYRSEFRVPQIRIETEMEDGKIKLMISDNGMGIDLDKHGHKLFGLNKVFHRHPDAKGVGLYMTKVQIEAMQGEIVATSKVNEGSTFTINF